MAGIGGRSRLVLLAAMVLALAIGGYFAWASGLFAFSDLVRYRDAFSDWIRANPILGAVGFFGAYVLVTAFSIPGAVVLTIMGGSLFGLILGTVIASFASVIGATIAMLIARYLLRGFVERRFHNAMAKLNRGVDRDGASYLFGLRLVPAIPFVAINLGMGMTRMPVWTYAWVSQLGMLPGTIIYVNAGDQMMSVDRAGDLLSGRLLLAFLALAVFPFIAKGTLRWWKDRDVRKRWQRPKRFDYNLVVIGGGSAGLVSAYLAAAAKAKVALIEQARMGGECLNTGCVPSKAMIRSAKLAHEAQASERWGLSGRLEVDFEAVMRRITRVIGKVAPHDSAERYRGLGVEVIHGTARIADPWTVQVDGRALTARKIIVATGAGPRIPSMPGLADLRPLTSDNVWSLTERPSSLLVVGGGAVGCELAQSFCRLGSKVVMLQADTHILSKEDKDVAEALEGHLMADGVEIVRNASIERFETTPAGGAVHLNSGRSFAFDQVLVAAGRVPRVAGFGLEELDLIDDGKLAVDERLQTRLPSIHAAGDVIGQLQFTHAAGQYGWIASANALFGRIWSLTVDMSVFPHVTYTDPEVARVGLTERQAKERKIDYELTRYDLSELDRAIADEADVGFIKVLTKPGSDKILGVAIVSARAGDLLGEFTLAMRHGLGLKGIMKTIHPYPGWMDANKATAAKWQRAHMPQWALALSMRWLRWRRG